ncbi:MATE family efflux transporter [Psychrosphaera sp. F3M07]|uniref:MATE family efflux transporter n=1 Tax=Psychrosphaera sp. F3M07 TaxID=2841560 RepID=UPI001C08DDCC|nr:MATE family efflux transporter [Psychrosphaera sp. F3M07]MBU2918665.1 MATE family efflux transporter [Psychrosphaera sp. F3M07]
MKVFDFTEVKHILKLAIPLLLTQITASLMFFTDTVMASRAGHVDMASVSIATGIWSPVIFSAQGLLIAITPVIAHLFGSSKNNNNQAQMVSTLFQGAYIAAAITLVIVCLFQFVHIPLENLDLETELHDKSIGYLNYVVWGILPTCLFFALRGFCEGIGVTKPALIVSVIALLANIPLNYIFVFGKLGAPELGGAGCGLATAIVQWISLISLLIYFNISRNLKPFQIFKHPEKPNPESIKILTKLGTPIALSLLFESSLFAFMALFIAPLGSIAVAGHQVAFSYSAVVFMFPLSLAMAATIRVGYLKGVGDLDKLKYSIKTCFFMAVSFGTLVMLTTFFFREQIILIYTSKPEVVALAASILVITAIYQLPDAIQVMAAGVFKGLKITKPLFYITFISYWPIGFTLGYLLGRTDHIVPAMGPQGFWVGTVIGLSTASVLFLIWLKFTMSKLKLS